MGVSSGFSIAICFLLLANVAPSIFATSSTTVPDTFPTTTINSDRHTIEFDEKLVVKTKLVGKFTFIGIRNNGSEDVHSLRIYAPDATIASAKVRGWNENRIDSSTLTMYGEQNPLGKDDVLVILLLVDNKNSALELIAFNWLGEVISYSGMSYGEQIFTDCDQKIHCTIEALLDLSEREDKNTVLLTFNDLLSRFQRSSLKCHDEGHEFGMFLYHYLGNLTEALSYVEPMCGGSVYHGIIHHFFLMKNPQFTDPSDIDITILCPEVSGTARLKKYDCVHGIGHGLAELYSYDVFAAAERCAEIQPQWAQANCLNGLFMQNAIERHESRGGTLNDDILFPCNALDPMYAGPCYNYQATKIIAQSGSLANSFKVCDNITPDELISYCYYGIGRQMLGHFLSGHSLKATASLCSYGDVRYQSDCYMGLARVIAKQTNINHAFEFCKVVPEQVKADCYDILGRWIHILHSSTGEISEKCSKAESDHYTKVCMDAELHYNLETNLKIEK